jgi:hypothetical protein
VKSDIIGFQFNLKNLSSFDNFVGAALGKVLENDFHQYYCDQAFLGVLSSDDEHVNNLTPCT